MRGEERNLHTTEHLVEEIYWSESESKYGYLRFVLATDHLTDSG